MKILTAGCCIFLILNSNAQNSFFQKFNTSVTSRHLTGVTVTSSADFILANTRSLSADTTQTICRLAPDGSIKWAKKYDIYSGGISDITETSNQEFIVVERRRDSTTQKLCPAIFKIDSAGNALWGKYIICDTGDVYISNFIRTTDSMNVLVANQQIQNSMVAFTKFDDAGNIIWMKKSSFLATNVGLIRPVENGGMLSMNGNYFNANYCYIRKIDNSGNITWGNQYIFNGTTRLNPLDATVLPNGNYIICCGSEANSIDSSNIILIEMDTAGTVLNAVGFNTSIQSFLYRAHIVSNSIGELLVMFTVDFDSGFLMKLNAAQQLLWIDVISNKNFDIKFVNDTDYIVTETFAGDCLFSANQRPSNQFTCFTPVTITSSSKVCTATNYTIRLSAQTYSEVAYTPLITPDTLVITQLCGSSVGLEATKSEIIKLYPNPAAEYLSVSIPGNKIHPENMEVFLSDGRRIEGYCFPENQEIKLKTSDLISGIYFIRIKTQDTVLTAKFLKD